MKNLLLLINILIACFHTSTITINQLKDTSIVEQLPQKYTNNLTQVSMPASNVAVLMFHYFYDETIEKPKDNNFYSIQKFEKQLKYFKDHHYTTLTMNELYNFLEGNIEVPKNSIVLTFDDGYYYTYDLALPILEKYNFIGTSFEITSSPQDYPKRLSYYNLELQSHSHNMHQGTCNNAKPIKYGNIQCIDYQQAITDLNDSYHTLDSPIAFAYPFGGYGGQAKDVLKETDFKLAFTTQYGFVKRGDDYLELPRIRMSTDSFFQY